jgi:hypothetical protein
MVPIELRQWALRHQVSPTALAELAAILGTNLPQPVANGGSEARVQSEVRLAAPAKRMRLFRNNKGALPDARGVPVRFGLCNDNPAVGQRFRSADLVGWRSVTITPEMVGSDIAQFTSLECKPENWTWCGDKHEEAQSRWAALVTADGGYAKFVTGAGQI